MKRYLESTMLVLLSLLAFTACSEDEGTSPGNDSQPALTINSFSVAPPLNSDNDVRIRVAANNKSSEAYLLAQKTDEKEAAAMSDAEYADYVVGNGTKLDLQDDQNTGGKFTDYVVTGLLGKYTITVVTVNGNQKSKPVSMAFEGLVWNDVVSGTYQAGISASKSLFNAKFGDVQVPTTLQQLSTDKNSYRLKDLYGAGYHLRFNLIDLKGQDDDGVYTFFRVPQQSTPFTYGNYGAVGIRDFGYWQGDDSYVTEGGYESGMYDDYSCFFTVQYFVSAGSLGRGYDYFFPNE